VLDKFMTPDVRAATDRLTSHEPWNRGQFNSLAADVLAHATLTARYWSFHNERFRELLNHVDFLIRRVNSDAPSLLEVGGSVFSKLLHAAFPRARIDILQHPVRRLPFQPRRFLYIDLETIRGTVDLGVEARYDVIVFSEVLEHLLANPVVVLRFLLRQLRPGGFILLTTPNLFDAANLERIEHRRNPFPVYPEKPNPARSNQFGRDVSHHVRLYCMSELLQFSRQAGGRVSAFRFSPCWDNPANLAELPANLRKNLVVVMQERAVTGAAPT